MHIDWQKQKLNLKIVYYGPALSGKTTNLIYLHDNTDPAQRSQLISLNTHQDRTLYFDFLQLELGKIGTLSPQIHLYTVPGQAYYEASRKMVLRGADGVIFVADSDEQRLTHNMRSWAQLHQHLAANHLWRPNYPIILQFNKQDLPTALPTAVLHDALEAKGYTSFTAVALTGQGVLETLNTMTQRVLEYSQKQITLMTVHP